MRIVVTGATGNVGTTLLTRLSDEDVDIVGVARREPPDTPPYDQASWVSLDIADSDATERLIPVLRGADAVVHLAIAFQPMRDREYLRRTNVGGTKAVAAAALEAGVGKFVHMSSSGVYSAGSYGAPVDESWPRDGIEGSAYSVDKAAAECALDALEKSQSSMTVVRLRPGLIGQSAFGSALLRYALPDVVPSWIVDKIPVVPFDRSIVLPAVATVDVAEAIVRAVNTPAQGAYNLAAPTPVRREHFESALGARSVDVPSRIMRRLVSLGFDARVQSVHPGWVDLAYGTPLVDTARARRDLGWAPTVDGPAVLEDTIAGMRDRAAGASAPLRPRSIRDRVTSVLHRGPVSRRHRP